MQQGMRCKHITSTDENIHITKHDATVSSQKGMRPKFQTSKEQSPAGCSKVLPSHDYHVGQCVAYQENTSKQWYPATITFLCSEKGTYMKRVTKGAVHKEMQTHLDKNCQSTQCEHMQPVKLVMTQSSHMQSVKPAMPQISHM